MVFPVWHYHDRGINIKTDYGVFYGKRKCVLSPRKYGKRYESET